MSFRPGTYSRKGFDVVKTVEPWHLIHKDGAYVSSHRSKSEANQEIDRLAALLK